MLEYVCFTCITAFVYLVLSFSLFAYLYCLIRHTLLNGSEPTPRPPEKSDPGPLEKSDPILKFAVLVNNSLFTKLRVLISKMTIVLFKLLSKNTQTRHF